MAKNLSQEYLKTIMEYDPDTGICRWKVRMNNRWPKEKPVGTVNTEGYSIVYIAREGYQLSHLIILYMLGRLPSDQVDHIDRNPSNNKWSNLREATQYENQKNTSKKITNTSGHKNIHFRKDRDCWVAKGTTMSGIRKYLGSSKDINIVVALYEQFAKTEHKGFYCGGI